VLVEQTLEKLDAMRLHGMATALRQWPTARYASAAARSASAAAKAPRCGSMT
jgi:hypothetical protein